VFIQHSSPLPFHQFLACPPHFFFSLGSVFFIQINQLLRPFPPAYQQQCPSLPPTKINPSLTFPSPTHQNLPTNSCFSSPSLQCRIIICLNIFGAKCLHQQHQPSQSQERQEGLYKKHSFFIWRKTLYWLGSVLEEAGRGARLFFSIPLLLFLLPLSPCGEHCFLSQISSLYKPRKTSTGHHPSSTDGPPAASVQCAASDRRPPGVARAH
jgi:hypothetical protein